MGLTTWENAPSGKIVKTDVSIAKNYLKETELDDMGHLVNALLDLAERMANRVDIFLNASGDPVLDSAGHITADYAKEYVESEFEKYRVTQDRLFQSDFDRLTCGDDLLNLQ